MKKAFWVGPAHNAKIIKGHFGNLWVGIGCGLFTESYGFIYIGFLDNPNYKWEFIFRVGDYALQIGLAEI